MKNEGYGSPGYMQIKEMLNYIYDKLIDYKLIDLQI